MTVDVVELVPAKGPIGKAFKKEAKAVTDKMASLTKEEVEDVEARFAKGEEKVELDVNGTKYNLTKDMVASVKRLVTLAPFRTIFSKYISFS